MYTPVLTIHSWLRWVTLLLAIGATINAWRPDRDLSQKPPGRQWDVFFMMALADQEDVARVVRDIKGLLPAEVA